MCPRRVFNVCFVGHDVKDFPIFAERWLKIFPQRTPSRRPEALQYPSLHGHHVCAFRPLTSRVLGRIRDLSPRSPLPTQHILSPQSPGDTPKPCVAEHISSEALEVVPTKSWEDDKNEACWASYRACPLRNALVRRQVEEDANGEVTFINGIVDVFL
ncbi:hypothetical protein SKAU_G00248250 [Synaphobranchus kaupii]|uniref:Uncharacterized protein n=1 Tax=Synaphobranchus kaupii TaxID=118154 RepID=A0A9Q1F2B9_SYNKA|nr:hypothetical protein SKAU_G00248250 [Synaphobranchus kaupii]